MTARPDDPRDPELERALSLVGRPAARPEFREALRERFLAVDPDLRDAAYARDPRPARPPRAIEPPRRRWMSLALVAAAAAVLLALFALRPRGPSWRLVDPSAAGVVRVDGRSLRTEDRQAFEDALAQASSFETGELPLRLSLGDLMLLEIGRNSRVSLSTDDKRGRSEPISISATHGSIAVRTGPGFKGSQMRVSTGDLDLRVTGTAFAVDVLDGEGTCVCCLEGSIEMRPLHKSGQTQPIVAGKQCVVHSDEEHKTTWGEVYEPHAAPVRDLGRVAEELWASGSVPR